MAMDRLVCRSCKMLRCGACGWYGRRKATPENMRMPCPKCDGLLRRHDVKHRRGSVCGLNRPRHQMVECQWCHRERRSDRMRRWNGAWQCKNDAGCSMAVREARGEVRNG